MNNKVLLVDDEQYVLSAYQRQLGKRFEISTATGGEEGLQAISTEGPFAVIVSDYKMPNMNGIEFLSLAQEISPDTARIMLTGNANMETAITAVNEGQIFRFLAKPYPSEQLALIIEAGIKQHRLVTAEKELLEKTLKGAVSILTEILGLVSPVAFSRASRMRNIVRQIISQLKIVSGWEYELAALLSQIGCVIVPSDALEKVYAGLSLSSEEKDLYDQRTTVAASLLSNIPRMQNIGKIIIAQNEAYEVGDVSANINTVDRIALGGHLLHVATVFDQLQSTSTDKEQIIGRLKNVGKSFDPRILKVLQSIQSGTNHRILKSVKVNELTSEMTLDEDVYTKTGVLMAVKGQDVNYLLLGRLQVFARGIGVREPIRVIDESNPRSAQTEEK